MGNGQRLAIAGRRGSALAVATFTALVLGVIGVWVDGGSRATQPSAPASNPAPGTVDSDVTAHPGPAATTGPAALSSPAALLGHAALPGPGALPAPAAPAGPAGQPASVAEVNTRITQLVGRRGGPQASIAALDLTDDRRYRYPSRTAIRTSGVIKLDILETVLLHAQQARHPLDAADSANAAAMIAHDDNDGADALWDAYGSAEGFRAANRELGTKHTNPDVDRYWGLATSDADDQLTLLRNLVVDRPLDAASRNFALNLLAKVDPAQAWGVSAAADPGSKPAIKTGAINADNDNGLWTAGSVGMITVRGHRVLLAVLTQHNRSRQEGIDLVNRLAVTAVAAVAPAP